MGRYAAINWQADTGNEGGSVRSQEEDSRRHFRGGTHAPSGCAAYGLAKGRCLLQPTDWGTGVNPLGTHSSHECHRRDFPVPLYG
jgi:hypothetical protein